MVDIGLIYGQLIEGLDAEALTLELAKKTVQACHNHSAFTVCELRQLKHNSVILCETIIVDCMNDNVPTWNDVGIEYPESLALVFSYDQLDTPSVYALRDNFPITLHQNAVPPGFNPSLCLYIDDWDNLQRHWTPQFHLERILWWLTNTANNTLHHPDQPVEQLFFRSDHVFMLPGDFDEILIDGSDKTLVFRKFNKPDNILTTYQGELVLKTDVHNGVPLKSLVITSDPIGNGLIEHLPETLGQLHDLLYARGVSLIDNLNQCISNETTENGLDNNSSENTLLILNIPRLREAGEGIERHDLQGFLFEKNLADIANATGVLTKIESRSYKAELIGAGIPECNEWRAIKIHCAEIQPGFTKAGARKASGLNNKECNFIGVIAGVGSLGSILADIWNRQGWGEWTYIDDDYIKPHNLARHVTPNNFLGIAKADSVKNLAQAVYGSDKNGPIAINDRANNFSNNEVTAALKSADLIVDASTTISVPRKLSGTDNIGRSVSVFFTPSGHDGVMLYENEDRTIRLDAIEAQYYRAILREDWGSQHLKKAQGMFLSGNSCRDVSMVIPNDLIHIHGSILARQIRLSKNIDTASAHIWQVNPDTGGIHVIEIPIASTTEIQAGDWRIVWDENLQSDMSRLRNEGLPNETGGILLGYVDQQSKSIYVVDALPAPSDSSASTTHFERGIEGVHQQVIDSSEKTHKTVGYIGDWHSHPEGCSSNPSVNDLYLATYLGSLFSLDGQPALMMIVSERNTNIVLCDANN